MASNQSFMDSLQPIYGANESNVKIYENYVLQERKQSSTPTLKKKNNMKLMEFDEAVQEIKTNKSIIKPSAFQVNSSSNFGGGKISYNPSYIPTSFNRIQSPPDHMKKRPYASDDVLPPKKFKMMEHELKTNPKQENNELQFEERSSAGEMLVLKCDLCDYSDSRDSALKFHRWFKHSIKYSVKDPIMQGDNGHSNINEQPVDSAVNARHEKVSVPEKDNIMLNVDGTKISHSKNNDSNPMKSLEKVERKATMMSDENGKTTKASSNQNTSQEAITVMVRLAVDDILDNIVLNEHVFLNSEGLKEKMNNVMRKLVKVKEMVNS